MKLDLFDEYQTPYPFPNDEFKELDIPNDQAYVMFSTAKTGTFFFFKFNCRVSHFEYLITRRAKWSG